MASQGKRAIQGEWADLRQMPHPPTTLVTKIGAAAALYPCEVIFIHRDAENASRQLRRKEIEAAMQAATFENSLAPVWVSVIPVRMQEAWLLFDENAIKRAAGNPSGRLAISLPPLERCEHLADPKSLLLGLLRQASGRSARRRAKLGVALMTQKIAEYINDFAPLRSLPAFAALEQELQEAIERHRWDRR